MKQNIKQLDANSLHNILFSSKYDLPNQIPKIQNGPVTHEMIRSAIDRLNMIPYVTVCNSLFIRIVPIINMLPITPARMQIEFKLTYDTKNIS